LETGGLAAGDAARAAPLAIGLTADLYTHMVSQQLRDALDRLDAALA
jgi:hypothetical protein